MPSKAIYEFSIIRYVPKVERGEFINVGAIVMCQRENYLKMKFILDENRLRSFHHDVDIELIEQYLNGWDLVCQGSGGGKIGTMDLHYRFRWLTAARSTIIQSSEVHPGLCDDPDDILEDTFRKYVL